jgi:excisionase family DNA binding protein
MGHAIVLAKNWWLEERKPAKEEPRIKPKRRGLSNRYYSVKEVAARFGVGIWGIYDAIHAGELDATPIGKRNYRISEEAVRDYLDLCERKRARA